ncbi:MAG: rRNA maturation RNase YbeY [bacterium]|nr:rRNA maturation RNase YbeY [bacterium]
MKTKFLNKQRKYTFNLEYFSFVVNTFIKYKIPDYLSYDKLELFISFVSSRQIRKLKNDIFGIDILTDVISLPLETTNINPEIPAIFGEIFICPQVANFQAKDYGNTQEEELTLLIIHGLLHLIGYKDYTDDEKKLMRMEEDKMLGFIEMERQNIGFFYKERIK